MKKNKSLNKDKKQRVPFGVLTKKGLAGLAMAGLMIASPLMITGCSNGQEGNNGLDYTDGAKWYYGVEDPTSTTGKIGDFYLETDDGDVWSFLDENGWQIVSNIKGPQGNEGQAGRSSYTHIRYSATMPDDNADILTEVNDYIGIYTGTSATAPTDYTAYTWYKIKGDDGRAESNELKGKSILAIGDSYVDGDSYTFGNTWICQLAERNEMTKYVYSQSGISIANSSESKGLVDKISTITSEVSSVDYIVLLGGHNDANASLHNGTPVPIGTNDDVSSTTYKGALNIMIESLLNKYPTSKMLFLTPFERYGTEEPYVTAMQEVCAKWSVPCFDNYHNSGICWQNEAQKEVYESQNLHFNIAGHERISYMYESILKNNLAIGGGVDNGITEQEELWISEFSALPSRANRVVASIYLKEGTTINFAKSDTWSIYKYAIGPGEYSVDIEWIKDAIETGSSYQTGKVDCQIPETGVYTIMFAKTTDEDFTAEEIQTLKSLFIITE